MLKNWTFSGSKKDRRRRSQEEESGGVTGKRRSQGEESGGEGGVRRRSLSGAQEAGRAVADGREEYNEIRLVP